MRQNEQKHRETFYGKVLVDNILANKKTLDITSCPIFDVDGKKIDINSTSTIDPKKIVALNNFNCLDGHDIEYDFINCMINKLHYEGALNARLNEAHLFYSLRITNDELVKYLDDYIPDKKKDMRERILSTRGGNFKLVNQDKRGMINIQLLPYAFSCSASLKEDYRGIVSNKTTEFYFQFPKAIFESAILSNWGSGNNFVKLPRGIIPTAKQSQIEYKTQNPDSIIQSINISKIILFGAIHNFDNKKVSVEVPKEDLIKTAFPNLICHKERLNGGELDLKYSYATIATDTRGTLGLVTKNSCVFGTPIVKSFYFGKNTSILHFTKL